MPRLTEEGQAQTGLNIDHPSNDKKNFDTYFVPASFPITWHPHLAPWIIAMYSFLGAGRGIGQYRHHFWPLAPP